MSEETLIENAETATTTEGSADNAQPETPPADAPQEVVTEGKTAPEAEAPVVPEKYEFAAPEGVTLDNGVMEAFSEAAKAAGLTQEKAQAVVDKVAPAFAARQAEAANALKAEWLTASKTDKEFGGDKLNENLGIAKKALDAFASPELKDLLNSSGLGNHPEVIRHFYRVGKAISEDRVVNGASGSGKPADMAKRFFPNMK